MLGVKLRKMTRSDESIDLHLVGVLHLDEANTKWSSAGVPLRAGTRAKDRPERVQV